MIKIASHRLWIAPGCVLVIAVGSAALFQSRAIAQATSAKSGATQSAPTTSAGDAGTIRKAEERIRIEPYTGPPIFLEEKKVVVPPSIVTRDPITDKFADGKLRIERQIAKYSDDHYESDGYYREYYPNGQKFIDGQYRQGRREGDWTYWFDNSQVNRMVTFQNGQLNGEWEVYRADGTLSAKQAFENGLRNGDWMTYDATGKQPLAEQHYAKGKTDGIWKTWHPNGKLQLQVSIKMGLRHGPGMQWNEDGAPLSESNWVEGKQDGTTTRWTDKGKIVQQYKQGLLVSEKKE